MSDNNVIAPCPCADCARRRSQYRYGSDAASVSPTANVPNDHYAKIAAAAMRDRVDAHQRAQYDYTDGPGKKDSNPKDRIGSTKVPLSLVPGTALSYAALAHLDGATKYGRWNWRIAGVRASIYLDAVLRHLQDWNNGEETASDGVHHLGHALACINILIDAKECGKLTDDRPPRAPMVRVFDEGKAEVRRIHERYEGMVVPRDFTIEDGVEGA